MPDPPPPPACAALVASAPVGRGWHALGTGLSLYDLRPRVNAVLPIPTGQLRVAWPAGRVLDLGLRYGTVGFVTHELGLFARIRLGGGSRWTLGASLEGSTGVLPWALQERLLFLDVAVRGTLSLGFIPGRNLGLHVDASAAARFYEVTFTEHGRFADSVPVTRSLGLAAALSWGGPGPRRYALRARVDYDPYRVIPASVGGVFMGVSFEWTWVPANRTLNAGR